jgi:hypothetical protein
MKITTQDGAVCIAPEDDEERQAVEITINTLPGWVVWLLRHKTRKTMHNQQRKESK